MLFLRVEYLVFFCYAKFLEVGVDVSFERFNVVLDVFLLHVCEEGRQGKDQLRGNLCQVYVFSRNQAVLVAVKLPEKLLYDEFSFVLYQF